MKTHKTPFGPSLYYASDKNVFDALNQHKVNIPTILELFERRNIIVSIKTPREDLAKYFARLSHDFEDHKDIAARLGIAPRREKITSMVVSGPADKTHLQIAASKVKEVLEDAGEVLAITRDGDKFSVEVQYTTIDYKVSEFAQRQVRDGVIEFVKSDDGYIVRNTQNEHVNALRDSLISEIEKASESTLDKVTISLFDVPDSRLRSKFFYELALKLPGHIHSDVTSVYVYKPNPSNEPENNADEYEEPHIERVLLRGHGVSKSELLHGLLDEDDYYITKISWNAREQLGIGHEYDLEANFSDPKDCTGFSFILNGVYPFEDGKVSSRRRAPTRHEIDQLSLVIESKARELASDICKEFSSKSSGGE